MFLRPCGSIVCKARKSWDNMHWAGRVLHVRSGQVHAHCLPGLVHPVEWWMARLAAVPSSVDGLNLLSDAVARAVGQAWNEARALSKEKMK
eukprot:7092935-Pyramimonas_sp.AAC.1